MLAIIDYGVGNLFSLKSSLDAIGEKAVITKEKGIIENADRIILPGVGAFCDAADKLFKSGLTGTIKNAANDGVPVMGICLGMQLLFDKSFEYGEYEGLGMIKGVIRPLTDAVTDSLKIPHMGWNALAFKNGIHPLFKYINEGDYVYFVHSYYAAECDESVIATAEYSADITAAAAKENVMGCQFHPEKSGETGLKILKSFCEMKRGSLC